MKNRPRTPARLLAVILILFTISSLLFTGCSKDNTDKNAPLPEIGGEAPDFDVKLLGGKTAKLSDYRGKVVLLNFWASWCGPCIAEMPDLQKLSVDYADDLVVLAVNAGETEITSRKFFNAKKYTYTMGYDPNNKIKNLYPSEGIPYTIIIGADGKITHIQEGIIVDASMYEVYKAYIDEAIAAAKQD